MPELNVMRFVSPPMDTNAYLVGDAATGHAVIIDPACLGADLLWECKGRGWQLDAVVLTHGHIDHISDTAMIAREANAPILVHPDDAPMLGDATLSGAAWLGMKHEPATATRLLHDGDTIDIGETSLRVVHSPGHTPGCICLLGEKDCFTGDLLFMDAVGRWDFPGGNQQRLIESIRHLISLCPGETRIHPGHGPSTTMDREQKQNPYLVEWFGK